MTGKVSEAMLKLAAEQVNPKTEKPLTEREKIEQAREALVRKMLQLPDSVAVTEAHIAKARRKHRRMTVKAKQSLDPKSWMEEVQHRQRQARRAKEKKP